MPSVDPTPSPTNGHAPIYVTQAQFARRKGVSPQAVSKAVKVGRIRTVAGKIELTGAEREWWENTDPSQALFDAAALPQAEPPAGEPGPAPKPKRVTGRPHAGAVTLVAKRAVREGARAERELLELARDRGELMLAAEAHRAQVHATRIGRDRLMAIPNRLGPIVASITDPHECTRVIEEEILRAFQELIRAQGLSESS